MTLILTGSSESKTMKKKITGTGVFLLMALCLLAMASIVQAKDKNILPTSLTLYEGQSKVIAAPGVERMSVGKTDMLSTTLLKNGEVVLKQE
mgnify:FL=1